MGQDLWLCGHRFGGDRSELRQVDHAFIAPKAEFVPSEGDWNALMDVTVNMSSDHRALLESPAARVLPAEFAQALSELDERRRTEEAVSGPSLATWRQCTVPPGPLSRPK